MYHVAIVALLSLVVLAAIDLFEELVPGLARVRTLATFTLGVVIALALDYSLFRAFGVAVRDSWMGIWGTGLILGALAPVWRTVLGFLGYRDEPSTTRSRQDRPRVAA